MYLNNPTFKKYMYEDFEFPFDNITMDEKISFELERAIVLAVRRCVHNHKKCALSFSGGLDSSIIAKVLKEIGADFTAYVVGLRGSADIEAAKKTASELKIELKIAMLKQEEIAEMIKAVMWITKSDDPITVSVALVLYAAAREAAKDGYKHILSGLGSDEIFAGYDSHAKALLKGWEEVHKECIRRVHHEINKDIVRDVSICKNFNIEPMMPFLDIDVVRLAMITHPKLKISNEHKKLILRNIAKNLNLPKDVYERKKKAAQYGSSTDKALRKTAKQSGFDSIGSYLKSQLANIYKTK